MHPRMEEVAGTMPAGIGRWLENSPRVFKALDRVVNKGRRVKTGTIRWFLMLYAVAALRRMRRRTLRHAVEIDHIAGWLATAEKTLATNYDLAVEVIACRRLVKGYSDTHARGRSKFDRVLAALPMLVDRADGADWLKRLKQAALMDEDGKALDGAVKTVATLDA
jgi:indolepyruvate ferredoxin oxidoreductase beta subunit